GCAHAGAKRASRLPARQLPARDPKLLLRGPAGWARPAVRRAERPAPAGVRAPADPCRKTYRLRLPLLPKCRQGYSAFRLELRPGRSRRFAALSLIERAYLIA